MLTGSKSRGGNLKVLQVDVLARRDGDGAAPPEARVRVPEILHGLHALLTAMDRRVGHADALRDGRSPAQRCAGSNTEDVLTGSKSRGGNLKVLQIDVLAGRDGY